MIPNQLTNAGTATLEGAGFVVAVATAHSSVVPAGEIISQEPEGGELASAGSTVTITVSLGEAPVVVSDATGGWLTQYEADLIRRRKRRKELEEARESVEKLSDAVDREIGVILQRQTEEDEADADLGRLQRLVAQFADREAEAALSERVRKALIRAQTQANVSAFLALDRELQRQLEEEEFAILMLLVND